MGRGRRAVDTVKAALLKQTITSPEARKPKQRKKQRFRARKQGNTRQTSLANSRSTQEKRQKHRPA
jgi:hypothetical protein